MSKGGTHEVRGSKTHEGAQRGNTGVPEEKVTALFYMIPLER